MDDDVKKLVESAEFRRYHEELRARRVNLFDVLRNAHYEIRHSNVLAWLLEPGETHGLGDRFLRRFMESLAILTPESRTERVRVERERNYVDIAVFLDEEKKLVAIENKVVELYDDAIDQAMGYDKELHQEFATSYDIRSVLLTTSSDRDATTAIDQGPGREHLSHMSWNRIHQIIESFYPDDIADRSDARAFVRQYLEAVERLLRPAGGDTLDMLLNSDTHAPTIKRLSEPDGSAAMEQVDETRRRTLEQLIGVYRQRPSEQRSEIKEYLKGKGITTRRSKGDGADWLSWNSEGSTALGSDGALQWSIGFYPGKVTLELTSPPWARKTRDHAIGFMGNNPIEEWHPPGKGARYPMEAGGLGYFCVYKQQLMESRDFAGLTFRESMERLRGKLSFAWDSDYKKIEFYFKCLAFDPRGAVPNDTARTTDAPGRTG